MLTLYFDCISKNVKTKIFHYKNETRYISIKRLAGSFLLKHTILMLTALVVNCC